MSSLQGHFLIASPHLSDGNFNRSVVLIVKHDDDGAFGLVLNRPTENSVAEIWKLVTETVAQSSEPVYLGGPVSGPLVAIHSLKTASESQVLAGVHFAARKDHLEQVVNQSKKPYRLFTGYSGWGSGQLEDELKAGGWLIAQATSELVFYHHDDLWERVIQTIGAQILAPAVKTKHIPSNPSLN